MIQKLYKPLNKLQTLSEITHLYKNNDYHICTGYYLTALIPSLSNFGNDSATTSGYSLLILIEETCWSSKLDDIILTFYYTCSMIQAIYKLDNDGGAIFFNLISS